MANFQNQTTNNNNNTQNRTYGHKNQFPYLKDIGGRRCIVTGSAAVNDVQVTAESHDLIWSSTLPLDEYLLDYAPEIRSSFLEVLECIWDINVTIEAINGDNLKNTHFVTASIDLGATEPNYGLSKYNYWPTRPELSDNCVFHAVLEAAEDWCRNMARECSNLISLQQSRNDIDVSPSSSPNLMNVSEAHLRIPRAAWNKLMHAMNGNIDAPGYVYIPLSDVEKVRTLVPPQCDPTNPAYQAGPQPDMFGVDKLAFFKAYSTYLIDLALQPAAYLAQNAWNLYILNVAKAPKPEPVKMIAPTNDFDWYAASEAFESLKKAGIYSYIIGEVCLSQPNRPLWQIRITVIPIRGDTFESTITSKDKHTAKRICHALCVSKLLGWSYEAKLNALMLSGDIETNPGPVHRIAMFDNDLGAFGVVNETLVPTAQLPNATATLSITTQVYKPGSPLGDIGDFGYLIYWKRASSLANLTIPSSDSFNTFNDEDYVVVDFFVGSVATTPPTPDTQHYGPIISKGVSGIPFNGSPTRVLMGYFWNGAFQAASMSVSLLITAVPAIVAGLDLTRYGIEPNPGPAAQPLFVVAVNDTKTIEELLHEALITNLAHSETVYFNSLLILLDAIDPIKGGDIYSKLSNPDPQPELNNPVEAEKEQAPSAPVAAPAGSKLGRNPKPKQDSQPSPTPQVEQSPKADRQSGAVKGANSIRRIKTNYDSWKKIAVWAARQDKIDLDYLQAVLPDKKVTLADLTALELIFMKIGYVSQRNRACVFFSKYSPNTVFPGLDNADYQARELEPIGLTVKEDQNGRPLPPNPRWKITPTSKPITKTLVSQLIDKRKKQVEDLRTATSVSMLTKPVESDWIADLTADGCVEKNPGPESQFANITMDELMANSGTVAGWRMAVVDKTRRAKDAWALYQAMSGTDPSSIAPMSQYEVPDIVSYNAVDPTFAPGGLATYETYQAALLCPRSTRATSSSDLVDSNQRLSYVSAAEVLKPGIKLIRTQLADLVVNISRGEAVLALRQNTSLAGWYMPIDMFSAFVAQMEGEFNPESFLIRLLTYMYLTQFIEFGPPGGDDELAWTQTSRFPWAGEVGKFDNGILHPPGSGGSYTASWDQEFSTVIFNEDCGGEGAPVFPFAGGETGSLAFGVSVASFRGTKQSADLLFIAPSLFETMPAGKAVAMTILCFCETPAILSLDINTRNTNGGLTNNQRFVPFLSSVYYAGRRNFGVMFPRKVIGGPPATAAEAARAARYEIRTGPRTTPLGGDTVLNFASDAGEAAIPTTQFLISWMDDITVHDWISFAKIHQALFGFTKDDWQYANEAVANMGVRFNFNICLAPDAARPVQPHNTTDALVQNVAYHQTVRKLPTGSFPYANYPYGVNYLMGMSNMADYNKVVTAVAFPESLPDSRVGDPFPMNIFNLGSVFSLKYIAQKHAAVTQLAFAVAQVPIGAIAPVINSQATTAFKSFNEILFSGANSSKRGFATVQPAPWGRIAAAIGQKALARDDSLALDRRGAPFFSYISRTGWRPDPELVKNHLGGTSFGNFDIGRPRILSDALMTVYISDAPRAYSLLPPGGGTHDNLKGIQEQGATFFSVPGGGYLGYSKDHSTGQLPQGQLPVDRWTDTQIINHRIGDLITGRATMGVALNGPVGLSVITDGTTKMPATMWTNWYPAPDYQMPVTNGISYIWTVARRWQAVSDWLPPATVLGKFLFPYYASIAAFRQIIFGSQIAGQYSTILWRGAFDPPADLLDNLGVTNMTSVFAKENFTDPDQPSTDSNSGVTSASPSAGSGSGEGQ